MLECVLIPISLCSYYTLFLQGQYQDDMEAARDEKEKRMPDMVRDLDTNIARFVVCQ